MTPVKIAFIGLAICILDATANHSLLKVKVEPEQAQVAGVKQLLKLRIEDSMGNGVPRSDLKRLHHKLLHVLVLSSDWQSFAHVHPEDLTNLQDEKENMHGYFAFELVFPRPGSYVIMAEFAVARSTGDIQVIDAHTWFHISAPVSEHPAPLPEAELSSAVRSVNEEEAPHEIVPLGSGSAGGDSQQASSLSVNDGMPVFVGTCVKLLFAHLGEDGREIEDLSPYLGAASHIAIAHESMELELLTHTHGSAGQEIDSAEPCGMGVEELPEPPAAFSKVVAYHRFTRPGKYAVVSAARRGSDVLFTRFVIDVHELPLKLYTNPKGPVVAGKPVELELRISAESFWGPDPSLSLKGILMDAESFGSIQNVQLKPSPEEGLVGGAKASVVFAESGQHLLVIRGLLHTAQQDILVSKNFTIEVQGPPKVKEERAGLQPLPFADFMDSTVAMVGKTPAGEQRDMTVDEIRSFKSTSDGEVKVLLEINDGEIAVSGHCTKLAVRVHTSSILPLPLSIFDGDAAQLIIARYDEESATFKDTQIATALPEDNSKNLAAEGFASGQQRDILRRLCSPAALPVRAHETMFRKAVAYLTFDNPGLHKVFVRMSTSIGHVNATFVANICPDSAGPIRWSSSCAWLNLPLAGERVLIPGGKHIILDSNTSDLEELAIRGVLEVENKERHLVINAGRVTVENGGMLVAGSEEEPFRGRLDINLNRGGVPVLGSGDLVGSGMLAVSGGSVRLFGSEAGSPDEHRTTLRTTTAIGATEIEVAAEAVPWEPGHEIVLASQARTPGSIVSEVATVDSVNGTSVFLREPLEHAHGDGAEVALLTRSIRFTSKQYVDGGSCVKIFPSVEHKIAAPGRLFGTGTSRRLLLEDSDPQPQSGDDLIARRSAGGRRLLHTDPTASLTRIGEFVTALGGDETAYYVANKTVDIVLNGVEFYQMSRTGASNPALEIDVPGDSCFEDGDELNRPPSFQVRRSTWHRGHGGCLHVKGAPGNLLVEDIVCYGAIGEGVLLKGTNSSCSNSYQSSGRIHDNLLLHTLQGIRSEILQGARLEAAGLWVLDWPKGSRLAIDRNLAAGSEGHGFGIVRSEISSFEGNAAVHNRLSGVLYGSTASCRPPTTYEYSAARMPESTLRAENLTLVGNLWAQSCVESTVLGSIQTEDVKKGSLPHEPSPLPFMWHLEPGVWTQPISLEDKPKKQLQYFLITVPEDAVSVKIMVAQLRGIVDLLVNPFGGAPCHQDFDGCSPPDMSKGVESKISTLGHGFASKPDAPPIINLPLPVYRIGTWAVAIGCAGCEFRIGVNVTRCGSGWMGFPSSELHLSPEQAATSTPQELRELAGMDFTCVPVIPTKANVPVRNISLTGDGASAFLKLEIEEFTSELWTRVRRVSHRGQKSSLHFRTTVGRLPTFASSQTTSARTLTAKYDIRTAVPDVKEAMEVQDSAFPVDHYSQTMFFLKPGTYYTVVTQGVKSMDNDNSAVAGIEVEVGTVRCPTGDRVMSEPYFFPPHHIDDMVNAAQKGPIKRSCNTVVHEVRNGRYVGPQGPSTRYFSISGAVQGTSTSVHLIDVPKYSSHLKIRVDTRRASGGVFSRGTVYLRYEVPALLMDQADYVSWEWDKQIELQANEATELVVPWYELYERWGDWYVVIHWKSYDKESNFTIEADMGQMPSCPGVPPCSGHGLCWSVDGRGACQCESGWAGEDCLEPVGAEQSQLEQASGSEEAEAVPATEAPQSPQRGEAAPTPGAAPEAADDNGPSAKEVELAGRISELQAELAASKEAATQLQAEIEAVKAAARATPEPAPANLQQARIEDVREDNAGSGCADEVAACEASCRNASAAASGALHECLLNKSREAERLEIFEKRYGGTAGIDAAIGESAARKETIDNLTRELQVLRSKECPTVPVSQSSPRVSFSTALVSILGLAAICLALFWGVRRFFGHRKYVALSSQEEAKDAEQAAPGNKHPTTSPLAAVSLPGLRASRKPIQD